MSIFVKIDWNLVNDEEYKLKISEGQIVKKEGKITKKEIINYYVIFSISSISEGVKYIDWTFKHVMHEFMGIKKEDIDKSEKSLIGIKVQYCINMSGEITNFKKTNKLSKKVKINVNKRLDKDIKFGMRPGDEELAEEFMGEIYHDLNTQKVFNLIRKFHKNYGLRLQINKEIETVSKFKRKIANENIPAIKSIITSHDKKLNKLNYNLHQKIDMDKTMLIFEKEEEAFRPFIREKLKNAVVSKDFNCEYKESFVYNSQVGLILNYEEHSYSKFGAPLIDNFVVMEIINE